MSLKETLGATFNHQESTVNFDDVIPQKEVICLYFSAHWCPPCRGFTPVLVDFYKEVNADNPRLEIIFVSSDKDGGSFKEYYGTMPWLAIPFADERIQALKTKFAVTGIPYLCVLKKDGELAHGNARADVTNEGPECYPKWASMASEAQS